MDSELQSEFKLAFRPRARLLQLLGDQLIGTPRLAVFELVKNSYDADAQNVIVTLDGLTRGSPTITVDDDGEGMSLDTIKNIWLVPADDHRRQQRQEGRRTRRHRLPLGEKGLGRFAAHKLGDAIQLITRAADDQEIVVTIDWELLIQHPFLADAEVTVLTRAPQAFTGSHTGTSIVISKLREKNWTRGDARRLMRQITSISSPFAQRSTEFEATLAVPEHPEWLTGIPDIRGILGRAPWHFRFTFDKGQCDWEYHFRGVPGIKLAPRDTSAAGVALQIPPERDLDALGNDQGPRTDRPRTVVADTTMSTGIGPIKGEFYVFDRDREVLAHLGDSSLIQNLLDESGGVRIYRDGIRVYNYGESGDDWLGLDLRRVLTPVRNISRNIIIGAIDVSLEASRELVEKTNREGFVENDAYRRLRQIVLGALSILEIARKDDKEKIRNLTGKGRDPETERIKRPLEELRTIAERHRVAKEFDPYIRKIEIDYEDMRETMLRAGLSGLGLAIVFHEIEHGVRALYASMEAGESTTVVRNQAQELVRILDGFSELLRKGDRKAHNLQVLLRRTRDINRVRLRTHNIRLVCPALEHENDQDRATFIFGLALGAANNLFDNAIHWLKVRWPQHDERPSPRAIYLDINRDFPEGPALIIADTGPGFQDEPERLTKPFFSRRPDGMGLGLYYANIVMELNAGHLIFPNRDDAGVPEAFDGAVVALVFPKASQ